jgi:flagellar hook-length control protein FliK
MSIIESSLMSPSSRADRIRSATETSTNTEKTRDDSSFGRYFDKEMKQKPAESTPVKQKGEPVKSTEDETEVNQTEVILDLLVADEEVDGQLSGNLLPQETPDEAANTVEPENLFALTVSITTDSESSELPVSTDSESVQMNLSTKSEGQSVAMPEMTDPEAVELAEEFKSEPETKVRQQVSADKIVSVEIDQNDQVKTIRPVLSQSAINTTTAVDNVSRTAEQSVQTPVNHARWGNELAQRISVMIAADGPQAARIQLNPANLGPLTVRLQLDDNQATINFVTQHHSVKEAIEASLPRLRDMMQEQGMNLVDVGVSAGNSDQRDSYNEAEKRMSDMSPESEMLASEADVMTQMQVDVVNGLSVFV